MGPITVPGWVLILGVLGVLGLLWALVRARKQVRCLRYCYLDLSDWTAGHLAGIRVQVDDALPAEEIPDDLRNWRSAWRRKVEYNLSVMGRAGLPPITERELAYPLED